MHKRSAFILLSILIPCVLVISALFTTPALADGGSGSTTTSSGSGGARSTPSGSGTPSSLPGGTKIVILDASGSKVPLGSQAAQTFLNDGDPVWCPSTLTTPTPGIGGCTASYTNLALLVTDITAVSGVTLPLVNGTIWIQGGADSSGSGTISLDGSSLPSRNASILNFGLTLKGGWKGCTPTCVGTIVTSTPTTFTNPVSLSITNWNNTLSLSDIVINGATGDGLTLSSTKAITLTRVKSNNNTGLGMSVISTGGSITLTSVVADGNTGGVGALLDNSTAGALNKVTVAGASDFSQNYDDGLDVNAYGIISVTDLTASGNGTGGGAATSGFGAFLNNTAASASAVQMTGTNIFLGNYNGGLKVTSNGPITANSVIANLNINNSGSPVSYQYGASFDNSSAATPEPVTLTGTNTFKYNGMDGLDVLSKGIISVNNVTANSNGFGAGLAGPFDGANLDNTAAPALVPASVKVTGTSNYFYGNLTDGLHIQSIGTVSAAGVIASNNQGGAGLYIRNNAGSKIESVSITGTNVFNGNDQGVDIASKGAITLSSVTAGNNSLDGVLLSNAALATSAQGVTMTGTNVFNGNLGSGLVITSYGAISLSNLNANSNGNSGALAGVNLTNTNPGAAKAVNVTISGANTFNGNSADGLTITSFGNVILNNLTADGNGTSHAGNGVTIHNAGPNTLAVGAVTLTGGSQFSNNYDDGLDVSTNGAVSLNSITANLNGQLSLSNGYGALINNVPNGTSLAMSVKLTGSSLFAQNNLIGLDITSKGSVTLNSVVANDNGTTTSPGVSVDNTAATTAQFVKLTGANTFQKNAGDGLDIRTKGSITANSLTAIDNGIGGTGVGASLDNCLKTVSCTNTFTTGITLTGVNNFTSNSADGLTLSSKGAISLTKVTADGNGTGGAGNGLTASTSSTFTATCGSFTSNNNYGLDLSGVTTGKTTLTGVTYSGNLTANLNPGGGTLVLVRNCPLP
jgi:hypothetical protein